MKTVQCAGILVEDADVASRYPGFVRREYIAVAGGDAPRGRRSMVSFRVPEAIVTYGYLVIDPRARELFINQAYWGIEHLEAEAAKMLGEDGFRFESDRVRHLPGRTLLIGGPLQGNYYHWMLSYCTRLVLAKSLVPEIYHDPAVKFLIDENAQKEPFISFLRALAIPLERITWADLSKADYQLEEGIIVSLPHEHVYYPELLDALAEALREGLGVQPSNAAARRIWISRQGLSPPKRRVANMDALSPVLARFGFEGLVLESMNLSEQIRAFTEARIVLGVHGAGLVNVIFCLEGCHLAVIEKQFNIDIGVDRFFSTPALCRGLAYEALVSEPQIIEGTDRDTFGVRHSEDLIVDPVELTALIERCGIAPLTPSQE